GWVWIPGAEWGPAWVSWEQTDQYVGWAPLAPGGTWNVSRTANAPGGSYLFAPMDQLGATTMDLKKASDLGAQAAAAKPVARSLLVDGARVPAGPSIEAVERSTGRMLPRVKITDLLQTGTAEPARGRETASAPKSNPIDRVLEARRAGEQAASETKGAQSR